MPCSSFQPLLQPSKPTVTPPRFHPSTWHSCVQHPQPLGQQEHLVGPGSPKLGRFFRRERFGGKIYPISGCFFGWRVEIWGLAFDVFLDMPEICRRTKTWKEKSLPRLSEIFTKKNREIWYIPTFHRKFLQTTGHFLIPFPLGQRTDRSQSPIWCGALPRFSTSPVPNWPRELPPQHFTFSDRWHVLRLQNKKFQGFLVSFLKKIEIGGSCCELSKIGETKKNPFRFRMFNPIIQAISVFNESNCSPFRFVGSCELTPWKINMEPKITQLKRKMIFQTIVFRFHVNLPGCRGYTFFTQHFTFRTSPVSNNPQLWNAPLVMFWTAPPSRTRSCD